jgi:hypothetical protein
VKDLCTTTDETTGEATSHSTRLPAEEHLAGHPKDGSQVAGYKLANYANQVIGYALADAALKNSSKSSCANRTFWFFSIFFLSSASLATLCRGLYA